jgi:molybdate transport system substrate-binding protein
MQSAMEEIALEFERATGHKISISFRVSPVVKKQIDAGAYFDVLIHQRDMVQHLLVQGKLAGHAVNVARSQFGVVVRAGAPKPEINSVEAFKSALYAAKSIGYSEGPSGRHFLDLLERLGVAQDIKPKIKPIARRPVAEVVANGGADLGIHQISEILPVPGAQLVGPLPPELQDYVVYAAGIGSISQQARHAANLVTFLKSATAVHVLKAKGMEPSDR